MKKGSTKEQIKVLGIDLEKAAFSYMASMSLARRY